MQPIFYFTMTSMVLAEMLICLYLLRPEWLLRSRRWRLACLYGLYLCCCSLLLVPAAVTAELRSGQQQMEADPTPRDPHRRDRPHRVQWV